MRAWFDLLVCQFNLNQRTISAARKKALSCEQNIEAAIEDLMLDYEGKALPNLRALVPSDLSVFLSYRVLQDMTGDFSDISDTYWKYYMHLVGYMPRPTHHFS